jgi:BlaI family penicillinase repressor
MAKRLRKTVPKERLSPSEWEIMRICWRLGRCTVREVLEEDLKTRTRDYRTILTFMSRMTEKGWLAAKKQGNRNLYSPAVSHETGLQREIDHFLADVVGRDQESWELLQTALSRYSRRRRLGPDRHRPKGQS